MPFTLSHAVLAPPLSRLSRGHLPIAALAIGCMTPDLYRLFTQGNITIAHQWAGIIFPDLPIGLAFCLVWYLIYRPVLYRFFGLRDVLGIKSFNDVVAFSLMCGLAVMLGTATHLIWDGLTHLDFRSFAFQEILAQNISLLGVEYPLHFILQIASSIITLPVLVWMCWHYYQHHRQEDAVAFKVKCFACFSLLISGLGGVFAVIDYRRYIQAELWNSEPYFFIGKSINQFMQTGLVLFSITCLLWLFLDRKSHQHSF